MEFRILQEVLGGGGGKFSHEKAFHGYIFGKKTNLEKEKVVLKCNQSTMTIIHDNNVYLL